MNASILLGYAEGQETSFARLPALGRARLRHSAVRPSCLRMRATSMSSESKVLGGARHVGVVQLIPNARHRRRCVGGPR